METYATRDYWLAAALMAKGQELTRLEWEGKQAHFIFKDEAACQQYEHAYWSGDLMVSAKKMADSLRTLKDRLYKH